MTRVQALLLALFTLPVGLYLLALLALVFVQDALIFPAPGHDRATMDRWAGQVGATPFVVAASDGVPIYGWHRPGDGTRAMLIFHGNGGDASMGGWFAQQLPGVDVISLSVRGYPGSGGSPSEAGFELDARAGWAHITQTLGIPADRVVIHGQSMGGAVALMLADEVAPAGVVLDSTFHSLVEVAATAQPIFPVRWLLRHRFPSFERAPNVRAPVLLLHGDTDSLIDVDHARRMAKLFPDVQYVEVPGFGHHTWTLDDPGAHAAWQAFLARVWDRPEGSPKGAPEAD